MDGVLVDLDLLLGVSLRCVGGWASLQRGISGGERKRLAIGVELLTDPAILKKKILCMFVECERVGRRKR